MILAINSATTQFGIALMKENGAIGAEYLISAGDGRFNGLMPAVHLLIESSGITPKDLTAVVTVTGPGSFTGLRVGLAAAKGMVHGLDIPLIGISSLDAIANQVFHEPLPVCALVSSRKGEVFAALFNQDDDQELIRISEDISVKLKDIGSIVDSPTLFIGNDFETQGGFIKDALGSKAILSRPYLWVLRASSVGELGLKRFVKNDFDDIRDLVPTYLRPPDIRPNPFNDMSEKSEPRVQGRSD